MLRKEKEETFLTTLDSFNYKKEVMRKYDVTSKSYDELYGEEQLSKYVLAFKAIKNLKGIILDAGCGTGLLYEFLNKANISSNGLKLYVGIDLSAGMLNKAKDKMFKKNISAELIRADADFLPFRNKIFDRIFAFTLLQNMPNPYFTCRELTRVIKKHGVLIISIPKNININVNLQGKMLRSKNVKDVIFLLKLGNKFNT